ncbi:MAG TPA: hypothetical protein VL970_11300, partial [Candidatus Acidoferrales bacterium]|nr:hypothetical protein [Candidatus Acidoferrales bacterium]
AAYNTNTAYVADIRYASLANYLANSPQPFACPAENYVSAAQRAMGWNHRVRSVALNAAVGEGNKYMSPNPYGWTSWYNAKKSTDFKTPAPNQSFVFLDVSPDSIDDILFYTPPYPTAEFVALPGNQHDGAAGITFADGHVEMHKWAGGVVPIRSVTYATYLSAIPCSPIDPDMVWLAQHTPQSP